MGKAGDFNDNNQSANAFKQWTAPNAEDVTINVIPGGTETDATKFLNKGLVGTGYSIVATNDIEIVSIENGGVTMLKGDPIPVAADTRFTRFTKQPQFTNMIIRILTANTNVQLLVL